MARPCRRIAPAFLPSLPPSSLANVGGRPQPPSRPVLFRLYLFILFPPLPLPREVEEGVRRTAPKKKKRKKQSPRAARPGPALLLARPFSWPGLPLALARILFGGREKGCVWRGGKRCQPFAAWDRLVYFHGTWGGKRIWAGPPPTGPDRTGPGPHGQRTQSTTRPPACPLLARRYFAVCPRFFPCPSFSFLFPPGGRWVVHRPSEFRPAPPLRLLRASVARAPRIPVGTVPRGGQERGAGGAGGNYRTTVGDTWWVGSARRVQVLQKLTSALELEVGRPARTA